MNTMLNALLSLFLLTLALDSRAADNLNFTRYDSFASLPPQYASLLPSNVESKLYNDDDGKPRSDKKYYVTTNSYASKYKYEDIVRLANPATGSLDALFEETTIKLSNAKNVFDVTMVISTPVKDFQVESSLLFKPSTSGRKATYLYNFSNFNMVFTDMTIKLEIEESNGSAFVRLVQVSALKGITYRKLVSTPFAMGGFEKGMKKNIKKFKSGVGGI